MRLTDICLGGVVYIMHCEVINFYLVHRYIIYTINRMNNTRKYNKRKDEYNKDRHIVTIFSSLSNEAPKRFKDLCYSLGKSLSENNYKISYGAATDGCSSWIVDGAVQSHTV